MPSSRYKSSKIFQIVPNAAENGSYTFCPFPSRRDRRHGFYYNNYTYSLSYMICCYIKCLFI